jgi:hypothetical protein
MPSWSTQAPRLPAGRGKESSPAHRLLDQRVVSKDSRVESDVAVLRRFGKGDVDLARSEVDGLRSDHDDCVAMRSEGSQSIEEHRP